MEEIKSNPILQFRENQLLIVRKCFGYDDLNKLKQDIDHFQDWISKQNHFRVKEFDRDFLERCLIYNKGSVERAKQRLDKLCTFNNLMPEFLQNFDIRNEFEPLLNVFHLCVLPKPTTDNYRIFATKLTGVEDSRWELTSFYRYMIVLGQYLLNHDYCNGYELIADTRNVTMSFIMKLNPVVIHKGLTLIIEAMGQRIKKIHLISGTKLFDTLLAIIKQGLTSKLAQRLVVHSTVESVYDYVPRELLPKDWGGDQNSLEDITAMNFKELCKDKHIARIKTMEIASTDEACRLSSKFNEEYSGMPGSFKSLCVD